MRELFMRILAITNMFPSAAFPAQGVFVREQIAGLRAISVDVEVLFVNRREEGPAAYFRLGSKIQSAAEQFEPDVIHVMYGGVMADQVVRQRHLAPVVATFHGSDLLGENLSGWTRKIFSHYGVHCSRRAALAADGVVVVARHLMNRLHGAVPADKIRVIPCGIDLEKFRPMDGAACKRQLGWDVHDFHVLFASSNGDPVKRPWLAKEAVALIRRGERPTELHFLSGVPNADVPVWLNASDVLLLTSKHEGSPTIVKEALACSLPVVSVDVGDVAERIEATDGCYVASPEPADLARKLCLVRRRGTRLDCAAHVAELSILNVARKLDQFYQEIVCTGRTTQLPSPSRRSTIAIDFKSNHEATTSLRIKHCQPGAKLAINSALQPAVSSTQPSVSSEHLVEIF
jgi:glycosyltransferase involved in cell wall biosynthesis